MGFIRPQQGEPPIDPTKFRPRSETEITRKKTDASLPAPKSIPESQSPKPITAVISSSNAGSIAFLPKFIIGQMYRRPIEEFAGKIVTEDILVKLPACNFATIDPRSFETLRNAELIQALDVDQLAALTPEILSHMTPSQLGVMTKDQAAYLLKNNLHCLDTKDKIEVLKQMFLDKSQRFNLGAQLNDAIELRLQVLEKKKSGFIETPVIDPEKIRALSLASIRTMDSLKIRDLFKTGAIQHFTSDQLQAIYPIMIKEITGDEWNQLPAERFKDFKEQQILYISPKAIEGFDLAHADALFDRMANLNNAQVLALQKVYQNPFYNNVEGIEAKLQVIQEKLHRLRP